MSVEHFTRDDLDAASEAGKYVLVDFYADWCSPCKAMAPHFEAAAAGPLGEQVVFAKVDTEQERRLAQEAGVSSIPTTVLFAGWDEIGRATGALTRPQIEKLVTGAIRQRGAV